MRTLFEELVEVGGEKKPRTFVIEDVGYDGVVKDPGNEDEILEKKSKAFVMAHDQGAPTYYERVAATAPLLNEQMPASARIVDESGKPSTDLSKLYQKVMV